MIDAEFEELGNTGAELDLADTDSLPWLEADADDEAAGGLDTAQIMLFAAALVLLLGAVVGAVWYFSNKAARDAVVAEGGLIEAPEGPVKERPENPGGKQFDGTGNVAPVVGEGGSRPAVVADKAVPVAAKPVPVAAPDAAAPAAPDTSGVGVQLAAYGTRARAEQGWSELSRRSAALAGVRYRIVEGKVDIGTVYRLQAVAANRAEADTLCAALKADGLACQIK